jgi:hypothetical protein
MAGVAFENVLRLGTPRSIELARSLAEARGARAHAKKAVEKFFQSRERLLSPDAYRALRVAVHDDKAPAAVGGEQPPIFTTYASAANAVAALETQLDETLVGEVTMARAALFEASRAILVPYLVFGAEGVRGLLIDQLTKTSPAASLPPRNNAARKVEQSLLLYLQRVAAKNDTFSEFGPSSWGRVDPDASGLQLEPNAGVTAREVFFERWTAHATAAAMNADPEVGAGLNGSAIQVPALEPHALEVLFADVQNWPEGHARARWTALLTPLMELPLRFAASSAVSERSEILGEARSRLHSLGAPRGGSERFLYAATNPIGEECCRHTEFRISEGLIDQVSEDAAPWIDLWRDSYAFIASRVAAGLRQVLEKAAPGKGVMPLPAFLQACEMARLPLTGPGLVALAVIAFQEVKAAFRERLRPHLGQALYDLTVDDCHVVRNHFQYPRFDEYTYPSADLQIAAASADAVSSGGYDWVVSELHPPVAMLHHGFYWGCPDKPLLNDAFASTVFGKPNFHFGFFAADFTSHTTVRIFDALPQLSNFVAPQRANPKWRFIPPGETEVYVEGATGDVAVRKADSGEPLGSFARAWVIPLGFHPFQFGIAPHTPRLRCGRVIVQRRSWTVTVEEFPTGHYTGISRDLVSAVERLRASRDWPRYIYIRPTEQALRRSGAEGRDKDTKPVFVDLESYLFLEIFHRWLVKAGELEVTEMLPAPDQLPWREADGHHTFELRTMIVPRS